MFQKLVVIEPLHLLAETEKSFEKYACQVVRYNTVPDSDLEIISRLDSADAVLINVTTSITRRVIEACPSLRYIGMCCTLYENESCSVDLQAAKEKGIKVTGVSGYGDYGVPEFVVSELISLLHGFHGEQWSSEPLELTDFPVGIIGAGITGSLVARYLHFFGAIVVSQAAHFYDNEILGYQAQSYRGKSSKKEWWYVAASKNCPDTGRRGPSTISLKNLC